MSSLPEARGHHIKTIPQGRNNAGIVHRQPDAPIPTSTGLSTMANIVNKHRPGVVSALGSGMYQEVKRESYELDGEIGEKTRPEEIVIYPVATRPLVPVFEVRWGGGRVYGGGTSSEALARAKRKMRNNHRSGNQRNGR